MATAKIFKSDGSSGAEVQLTDTVFGIEANTGLVHQVAVALRNNQRQGNHKTKERAEVRGGGRKPFRQKGTGNARQGSTREPQMRGGGTVFGPRPRSYRQDVPVKMRRKALCIVLSDRVRSERLAVLEGLPGDSKTKPMAELVGKVAQQGRKTLLILSQHDDTVLRTSRNIAPLTVRTAQEVNALDVLNAREVIVLQDALKVLEDRLS